MADQIKTTSTPKTTSETSTIDMSHLQAAQAMYDHEQRRANTDRKPVNGSLDKFDEVRIRVGQIDNYLIDRAGQEIDPLKTDNVINMKTGKVVIRWIEYTGGIARPDEFGYPNEGFTEPWKYYPDKDSKYPEKRTLDAYNHDKSSEKEMLDLTHAFMWNNGKNWCGINSLPPVGSIVVVGFMKNNLPVILGYLQTDYANCKPYLKPGETLIKGYGDNYAHWRWSDKMDIHLATKKGKIDLDDPYKKDQYPATLDMWVRFDCFTRNIFIDLDQHDNGKNLKTTIEIKPEVVSINALNKDTGKKSSYVISTDDIVGISTDKSGASSSFYINPTTTKLSSGNGSSTITLTPTSVNIKSGGNLTIDAAGAVNIRSGNDIILTSAGNINLN